MLQSLQPCVLALETGHHIAQREHFLGAHHLGIGNGGLQLLVLSTGGEQGQVERQAHGEKVGPILSGRAVLAVAVTGIHLPLGLVFLARQFHIHPAGIDAGIQAPEGGVIAQQRGDGRRGFHRARPVDTGARKRNIRQLVGQRRCAVAGGHPFVAAAVATVRVRSQPFAEFKQGCLQLLVQNRQPVLEPGQLQLGPHQVLLARAPHDAGVAGLGHVRQLLEQRPVALDQANTFTRPPGVQP